MGIGVDTAFQVIHSFKQGRVGWREIWYIAGGRSFNATAGLIQPEVLARVQLLGASSFWAGCVIKDPVHGLSKKFVPSSFNYPGNSIVPGGQANGVPTFSAGFNSDNAPSAVLLRFGETAVGYNRAFYLRGVPDGVIGYNQTTGALYIKGGSNNAALNWYKGKVDLWKALVFQTYLMRCVQRTTDGSSFQNILNITADVNGIPTVFTDGPLPTPPQGQPLYVRLAKIRGTWTYPIRGIKIAQNIDRVGNSFTIPMQVNTLLKYAGFGLVFPQVITYVPPTYMSEEYYTEKKTGKGPDRTRGRRKRKPLNRTGAPVIELYAPYG